MNDSRTSAYHAYARPGARVADSPDNAKLPGHENTKVTKTRKGVHAFVTFVVFVLFVLS